MFYTVTIKDHIRVPPINFGNDITESVRKSIQQKFTGFIDANIGIAVDVVEVKDIGEGVVIPGDGASYYDTAFDLLVYRPELQEVILGRIKDITDFGAFITMGPIDGMIHVSQTMDDFVSFSKEKVLTGRDTKQVLKVNDLCRARVIAVSFKEITNPKIGLTMRQPNLGKLEWIEALSKEPAKEKEKPKKEKSDKK
ncbi:DNA-directed RNA polymerase [Candidatus Woesearchaeota archaeon]|nr:DNA-directed RNA polymerase [Candidatus Woesearchaeota archaeon]